LQWAVALADDEDRMVRTTDAIYGGCVVRFTMKDVPMAQANTFAALLRD
jgi:hypothetical protein